MPLRQAYFPRMLPFVALGLVAVIAGYVVARLLGHSAGSADINGAFIAWLVLTARMRLWRHRHPVLTIDEYIAVLRRNAPYN